jgi:hypothetical protein
VTPREQFIAAAVAAAPEMTDAQAERIASVLRGSTAGAVG